MWRLLEMNRRTRVLSMRDRLAILQMYKDGLYNQKELAEMYGVSQPRISQILNDKELRGELDDLQYEYNKSKNISAD